MLSLDLSIDGERESINFCQYVQLFSEIPFYRPSEECYRDEIAASGSSLLVPIAVNMDRMNKKLDDASIIAMPHFLVNNPNISVYPTNCSHSNNSALSKQLPVSTVNRVLKVSVPISAVSSENVTNQEKSSPSKSINSTETKNSSKRIASSPISSRSVKVPRLSISKLPRSQKEKTEKIDLKSPDKISESTPVKNNKIKKVDSSPILAKVTATSSSSANIVSHESTSPRSTKQLSNAELNNAIDSIDTATEDGDGHLNMYQFKTGGLSCNVSNKKDLNIKNNVLEIRYNGELIEITNPPMIDEVVVAVRKVLKKNTSNEEFEQLKTTSRVVKSPEHDRSSEEKDDVSPVHSKSYQTNLNNILPKVQSIGQPNKSQRLSSHQQQPSSSKQIVPTTQLSTSTKQNVTVTNSSSKVQLPNKPNELKEHQISNNQSSTLLKHPVATVAQSMPGNKQVTSNVSQSPSSNKQQTASNQLQPLQVNKQIFSNQTVSQANKQTVNNQQQTSAAINKQTFGNQHQLSSNNKQNNQQPSKLPVVSVSDLPLVTKQLLSGKSSTIPQSSTPDIKKCSKCKAVTEEDDVCTTCRMSSQLKGVTVTRIETPGTQPIPTQSDDNIIQLLSSDEEEEVPAFKTSQLVEPIIFKTESLDLIKKYLDKLNTNPMLLEDKLWQKDFSAEDYFKFEQCRSIHIGSFNTLPITKDDLLICIHGIRMTVNNMDDTGSVTIDIHIDDVVKILAYYAEKVITLFIYTNYVAAVGIQHLLKMDSDKYCYYNPLSSDKIQKKITWSVDLSRSEIKKLEKFLLKFRDKYDPLTKTQYNDLIAKNIESEENKYGTEMARCTDVKKYENTKLIGNNLYGRQITPVRIIDYRVLEVEEFLNDIIMEFYLNWLYVCKLSKEDQNRTYLFNSFFYTQLTKVANPTSESKAKSRHNRVKKWTKNVNVFEKDFIVIPINESYHWFLAVICFPYLSGPVYFDDGLPAKISNDKPDRPYHPPIDSINAAADEADGKIEDPWDFQVQYTNKNSVNYKTDVENLRKENRRPIKQPCILIFDSLSGGVARARIVATLREWLAEEYKNKHNGIEKDFSPACMKGGLVKVPQQPNNVDCGLFVFHYVEKFFTCPIVDYHFPITHLENWFPTSEVTKKCQKRKEVQNTILNIIDEEGGLPPGVQLPILNFRQQRYSNDPYDDQYLDSSSEEDVEEEQEQEEEDDEDFVEDDEYEEGDYSFPGGYMNCHPGHEDDSSDQREYFDEMAGNDEWTQEQHDHDDNGENFNSEQEYEEDNEDLNQYHMHHSENDNNLVVNVVDDHCGNYATRQNIPSGSLRSFRVDQNQSYMRHHNEVNDEDVDDDDDDDNDNNDDSEENNDHNQLTIQSRKRHYNKR